MRIRKHGISLRSVLFHVLVIGWMMLIYCFSAQQGDESADVSGSVSCMLVKLAEGLLHLNWDEAKVLEVASVIGYPVRKTAHMTEYGILFLFLFGALGSYEKLNKGKIRWFTALTVTFLYACTDEVHQLFVPNRYGCFTDVLIDTTGAVIALGILALIMALKSKNKNKN